MFKRIFINFSTTLFLISAIIIGSLIGSVSPDVGALFDGYIDYTLLILVALLFFEVKFEALSCISENLKFILVAWITNFILIPIIGFVIASFFLSGQPLFFTGLLIYFIAPCTDWFLGFTKLANGNTSLGAVLIPINMISQLILYPVYLVIFVGEEVGVDLASMGDSLMNWFFIPFIGAILLRIVFKNILSPSVFEHLLSVVGQSISTVIAVLVVFIFSANIGVIFDNVSTFSIILGAVFIFFVVTYLLGEGISKLFKFAYPEHVLLSMTTAARNAPLMLGITAAALPDQPLIYAAIIIGMLVEFPHLTVLKSIMLRKDNVHD